MNIHSKQLLHINKNRRQSEFKYLLKKLAGVGLLERISILSVLYHCYIRNRSVMITIMWSPTSNTTLCILSISSKYFIVVSSSLYKWSTAVDAWQACATTEPIDHPISFSKSVRSKIYWTIVLVDMIANRY